MPGKDCEAIPFQSPRLPPRPACYHGSTLSKLCLLWQPDTQAGDQCPHLPGDRQAHWEVLDHDCFSVRQEGVSPYLWMLSGME